MSWSDIMLTALSLSVDALICSILLGKNTCSRLAQIITGITIAFSFGLFQFIMPIIGFLGGKQV